MTNVRPIIASIRRESDALQRTLMPRSARQLTASRSLTDIDELRSTSIGTRETAHAPPQIRAFDLSAADPVRDVWRAIFNRTSGCS